MPLFELEPAATFIGTNNVNNNSILQWNDSYVESLEKMEGLEEIFRNEIEPGNDFRVFVDSHNSHRPGRPLSKSKWYKFDQSKNVHSPKSKVSKI